ncbi:pre-mRNA-splicing regulator WTAP-like isoform X1 [Acropora millepora]|uniref:pre-mRNA-splicing regulator WTAP-like isoform X1 n=1 Tax=Acropora millepora TaxID=45264 RepID=UPI001CF384D4|nr:pre-mRNA-splicing regulator WTAP-like isoform X1 [Acropora millepora]
MAENEEASKRKSEDDTELSEPLPKRVRLELQDLKDSTKEEILERVKELDDYVDFLEKKHNGSQANKELAGLLETGEKLKQQQQESTRRENVLVMRLATKEQEMQDLLTQIHDLKQAQNPSSIQLRSTLLDPAVNLLFQRMKTDLDSEKGKLEQAQNDLSAWKFTPDSVTGKKLMAKCRMLIQENQELGRQLSQGKVAQLEAELALQKKYSDELKGSQDELNDFVIQLDEEVEGMQSTILTLQQQLRDSKQQLAQSQEQLQAYEDKLKTNESLLANMRQEHSPVSLKCEGKEERAKERTSTPQEEAWSSDMERATGAKENRADEINDRSDRTSPAEIRTSPPRAQCDADNNDSEERRLLSAAPETCAVPASKPVSGAPTVFSISQILSADSNVSKAKKEQNSLENGGTVQHKSPPLEPLSEIAESPLVAAMGLVERIGCDSNNLNGEVTG